MALPKGLCLGLWRTDILLCFVFGDNSLVQIVPAGSESGKLEEKDSLLTSRHGPPPPYKRSKSENLTANPCDSLRRREGDAQREREREKTEIEQERERKRKRAINKRDSEIYSILSERNE